MTHKTIIYQDKQSSYSIKIEVEVPGFFINNKTINHEIQRTLRENTITLISDLELYIKD